ncbi:MAG: beta-ketoacyl-ACP synthase II [Spirochaetaceae bacterium]|jgi:3-oxoacyl-[acyl-carrier-protein] synthase II|nr:beta-ketoacyl-ACP synthase II [Spirochaetaceae bacterium]
MGKMGNNFSQRRVVITGLGTINPLGNDINEFWNNLALGKSGIRKISSFDIGDYDIQIAGEVDLPDLTPYFASKKMTRRLDRYNILAHIAGMQALKDSGLDVEKDPTRYGTLIGNGVGGLNAHFDNSERIVTKGMTATSPFYAIACIPNTASAYLALEAGLKGPSFSLNSACSSGNHSFGVSAMMIKMGMADVMFAGGVESIISKLGISAFGNIGALSNRNDSPETASRPFDIDRNGFVIGEGAGVFCLEELEHAKKRGAKIYGELSGVGFSCDANDLVAPHPEGEGAVRAIEMAINEAGINTDEVGLINCHGTSTPLGDKIESVAINTVFKDKGNKIPVHSTKSMIGHLIGGASAVEAVADMRVFVDGTVHPTINVFNQDSEINLNVVTETYTDKKIDHILSNAFGFGGQNAAIMLSRYKN